MYEELVNEIIEGRRLGKEDDLTFLIDGDLESLSVPSRAITIPEQKNMM